MDNPAVERFVRDTLGCRCPDELFRDLRVEAGDGTADASIHVGGRLLVLLLDGRAANVEERFSRLLLGGRLRRDAGGYNRVRFVLVTGDPLIATSAAAVFQSSGAHDERTHLHVIHPESIPLGLL